MDPRIKKIDTRLVQSSAALVTAIIVDDQITLRQIANAQCLNAGRQLDTVHKQMAMHHYDLHYLNGPVFM